MSFRLGCAVTLFGCLCIGHVQAGLTINPVRLELSGERQERSSTITLENSVDQKDRNYEVSVYKWTQDADGKDILTPDDQLMVNPKTINIPMESKKSVRIGFKQPIQSLNLQEEQSWRLLFNEIPSVQATSGMDLTISFSIPLFVDAEAIRDRTPKLEMKLTQNAQGEKFLQVKNLQKSYVKIMSMKLQGKDAQPLQHFDSMKYLLTNKSYTSKIEHKNLPKTTDLKVSVKIDDVEKPYLFNVLE